MLYETLSEDSENGRPKALKSKNTAKLKDENNSGYVGLSRSTYSIHHTICTVITSPAGASAFNLSRGLVFQDSSQRVIYEEMNDTELLQAVAGLSGDPWVPQ